ncbi:MAG TPA: MoxR family ATPase [Candidatus Ruania gallistercoris]|uniref:MoxR family ATPase n=1 Tax=Candidatus Ruania gallistercoris TaxID=2838746 RepID=A0A9D2EIA2_9MICO|nr:MoxR family ATPase [Candidatus Ruania gallistercoris]
MPAEPAPLPPPDRPLPSVPPAGSIRPARPASDENPAVAAAGDPVPTGDEPGAGPGAGSSADAGAGPGADPAAAIRRLEENLTQVLPGRPETVRTILATFLAHGHLLLHDVPGVGKTTVAKALATSVSGTLGRIQFTPDLLPSDLTGVTIYRQETGTFEFHPGPLFATVVIGDEINRASPKTQSALLECMAERQVTVDGTTHRLPEPFMVIATQNPVEMDGTYRLPEAQQDRFMARVSLGYPPDAEELAMLATGGFGDPLSGITAVMSPQEVQEVGASVQEVHVSEAVLRYLMTVLRATREHPSVQLGASPRAGLHLVALAKALAYLQSRDYVLPDDVQSLGVAVLAHRLTLARSARVDGTAAEDVVADILARVPVDS